MRKFWITTTMWRLLLILLATSLCPLVSHAIELCSTCDQPPISARGAASLHAKGEVYGGYDPNVQAPEQILNEARTVYLGNLQRRQNGAGPLRWNRELTKGARWFSFDSIENRPPGFCGHQDTLGTYPGSRVTFFGYRGGSGAENAFCGYVSPEDAIAGWMNSPGHRANLLDPQHREIGVGYYRRADGRGYVTQDFGADSVYPPVVINDEAINTNSPTVSLYIYNNAGAGGFDAMGAATKMMVSNSPDFAGATWENYAQERTWTLNGGNGWRQVYVRLGDGWGRGVTVSDSIFLGNEPPASQLGFAQMSVTESYASIPDLNTQNLPQVMFSPGWLADDRMNTFGKLWGNGESVTDEQAHGGTAMRLFDGNGESSAWVWTTIFPKDLPLVAFARLKVSDNTSPAEVARFQVKGGGQFYGPLVIKGTDFSAANTYQEFALPFTFNTNSEDGFLIFQFWRSGQPDIYVDDVSIFTAPLPANTSQWHLPEQHYRGQTIWLRYTDGNGFYTPAQTTSSPPANTPPTIVITAPVTDATLNALSSVTGTVSDNGSGINRVQLLIHSVERNADWDGTKWVPTQDGQERPLLPVTLNGTNWSKNDGLPADSGHYNISALATDNAGNQSVATADNVTIIVIISSDTNLTINDVAQAEGQNGTSNMVFTVTLAAPSSQTVTVQYATADGTATAGSDYTAKNGTLTIPKGQTTGVINVPILGDTVFEANETFLVNLSNVRGAIVVDNQGRGTIENDDVPPPPTLTINNVSVTEGNTGTTNATFTVSLSAASSKSITVDYSTANGTFNPATAGSDYTARSGTLSFAAGETTKTIAIQVTGDTLVEPDETFLLNLSNPVNTLLPTGHGVGTIVDDDGAEPVDSAVTAGDDVYDLILGPPGQIQQADVILLSSGIFQMAAPGVLANDGFVKGATLTVRPTSNPKNGRFQLRTDGSLFYLPSTGTVGVDEFTYSVSDGKTTATAKIRLNVIDHRDPELRLDTPADRATVATVPKVVGRVRDRNAGLKSVTLLWQRFDGKFWNGNAWSPTATELPLVVQGINWSYTGKIPAFGTLATTSLLAGRYDLRVTATDKSGNHSSVTNRITVTSAAPVPAASLSVAGDESARLPIALSTTGVRRDTRTILLSFNGALDSEAARNSTPYRVEKNGEAMEIKGKL